MNTDERRLKTKTAGLILLLFAWLSGAQVFNEASIVSGKNWELLGHGYQLTADSTVAMDGTVYFTDAHHNRIGKIDPAGKISIWKEESGGAHGIAIGPDGRLYAGQHDRKRIVRLASDGRETVVIEGVQTHHLIVSTRNEIYFADAPNHTVWMFDAGGKKRAVTTEINWPHCMRISNDQAHMIINDPHTRSVWSFAIQRDGSLANGRRAYQLSTANGSDESDAGGMTFDTEGWLYVSTNAGVQVFDSGGRTMGIIGVPGSEGANDVYFAGPEMKWLYVHEVDKVYRRPARRRGVR
jgi:gluconolactonase